MSALKELTKDFACASERQITDAFQEISDFMDEVRATIQRMKEQLHVHAVSQSPVADLKDIPEGTTYTGDTERSCDDCNKACDEECNMFSEPKTPQAEQFGAVERPDIPSIPYPKPAQAEQDDDPYIDLAKAAISFVNSVEANREPKPTQAEQEQGGDDELEELRLAGLQSLLDGADELLEEAKKRAEKNTAEHKRKDAEIETLRARLDEAEAINRSNCEAATRDMAKIARLKHENAELKRYACGRVHDCALWQCSTTGTRITEKSEVK